MYEELVQRLRYRGSSYNGISLFDDAADAIETLTVQLTEKSQEIERVKADYDRINDFDKSQCAKLLADLKKIKSERDEAKAELDHLKHERDQAVEKLHRNTDDAVPVVRCKDCKYWDFGDCYRLELSHPDDFCSYGERKEN